MCFPLKITKWFYTKVLRQPFFTFDGSAQYLTSPTAPYLIAQAYKEVNVRPPVMIASVRDPVSQAMSWWRYENNAIEWGEGMGLRKWNTSLRSPLYPPTQIIDAIKPSFQNTYDVLYENSTASDIVKALLLSSQQQQRWWWCWYNYSFKLPDEMITWPGGQLCGIGRNGFFYRNISTYNSVFNEIFNTSGKKYINVVSLEDFATKNSLITALNQAFTQSDSLMKVASKYFCQPEAFVSGSTPSTTKLQRSNTDFSIGGDDISDDETTAHRNAGLALQDKSKEPTISDIDVLIELFAEDVKELERYCKRTFTSWSRPTNN